MVTLVGLLVYDEEGFVVRLSTRKVSGSGELRPAVPNVVCFQDFSDAMEAAKEWVESKRWWTSSFDVEWALERVDGGVIPNLAGPSLGLAFALALARLFVDEGPASQPNCDVEKRIAGVHLENVAATGTVSEGGVIGRIGGLIPKLLELLTDSRYFFVQALVVAGDQKDCLNPQDPELRERLHDRSDGDKPFHYRRDDGSLLVVIPARRVDEAISKLFSCQAGIISDL